jgi:hypothetical protein
MEHKRIVREHHPRARACRYHAVLAQGRAGLDAKGCWVVYSRRGASRRLGWGHDEQAAWRSAAARLREERVA